MAYTLPNVLVNGTTADAGAVNANFTALLAAANNSIARDGSLPPTASIGWGNQNLTAVNELDAAVVKVAGDSIATAYLKLSAGGTISGATDFTGVLTHNGHPVFASDTMDAAAVEAALGFTPPQQGNGTGMAANVVHVGWDTGGKKLLLQIDSTAEGALPNDTSGRASARVSDGTAVPSGGSDGDTYYQYV